MNVNYGLNLINSCPPDSQSQKALTSPPDSQSKKALTCPPNSQSKIPLTFNQIISWNNEPFLLLEQNGYTYIEPGNIKKDNKINPTNSRGENVIDHVWVKHSLLQRFTFSAEIYDGFGELVCNFYNWTSDHKPVIVTIIRKSDSKAEQSDSKAEQSDSKAEQSVSKAEQSVSKVKQSVSKVKQSVSKAEQSVSKRRKV